MAVEISGRFSNFKKSEENMKGVDNVGSPWSDLLSTVVTSVANKTNTTDAIVKSQVDRARKM